MVPKAEEKTKVYPEADIPKYWPEYWVITLKVSGIDCDEIGPPQLDIKTEPLRGQEA